MILTQHDQSTSPNRVVLVLTHLHFLTLIYCFLKSCLVFGSHQRWCEMLHKNVLSRVVHTISGVIRKPIMQNTPDRCNGYLPYIA